MASMGGEVGHWPQPFTTNFHQVSNPSTAINHPHNFPHKHLSPFMLFDTRLHEHFAHSSMSIFFHRVRDLPARRHPGVDPENARERAGEIYQMLI